MEFTIGTIVDVKERTDLRAYGKITALTGESATVHFRQSRVEKRRGVCDACGWPGFLSVSGNTGEIVCMKSGCGHGHGFNESDEIIPVNMLINISAKRARENREKFLKELEETVGSLLHRGVRDNAISLEEQGSIIQILDRMKKEK